MRFILFPMLLLSTAVAGLPGALAQVPNSDIWLADIRFDREGVLHLENPVNVTNRPGYDNQPAFLYVTDAATGPGLHTRSVNRFAEPMVGFLFTSADSLGSTDIFRWNPYEKKIVRVTHTAESEYSPTPFGVGRDGGPTGFDVVRVEADSTQRLWRFDMDGSNPRLVMSEVDSIGYFAWIDDNHLAAFVLGNEKRKEPHTLRVVDVRAQTETIVSRDIGRAIHRMPDGESISFTQHQEDDTFRFMVRPHGAKSPRSLIDAVGAGQDAAWLGIGPNTMLMSSGPALYCATFGKRMEPTTWRQVADLSGAGIAGITRIAASPYQKQIAFVATTTTP